MTAKRVFDLMVAALGLLIFWPLLLLIAIWVKLDSRGPVFFRQDRVGQYGKIFRIHKFRTMVIDAEAKGPQLTIGRDRRITPSGRFLRKYKLDELGQVFDVLRGDMSLVGPRPEVPKYVAYYPPDVRDAVLSVKPGITDFASIQFRDENAILAKAADPERAYIEEVLPIKLDLYRRYVDRRSFWLDLQIVFRTLIALVR